MEVFNIPDRLAELTAERRVIPFIGAGFSAVHGLPGWAGMLNQLTTDLDCDLTPQEISEACNGDPLQIAEYLFLLAGKQIGPLRHSLSGALRTDESPLSSGAHIELVNLNAPQVYTTNFDELIERAYRSLDRKVDVIALPRDVARTHGEGATEVVKYHGDLRHEHTLVLTESQYYTRLDFESPMDLKFRSDLLGRAVLFMGYSFRDINIRVIWFKLMQMMKDVPPADRMTSYIVRFEPNPVLESLYEDVGLKTIVIDPDGKARTAEARNYLFADFMLALAVKASPDGTMPQSADAMVMSPSLLRNVQGELAPREADDERFSPFYLTPGFGPIYRHLVARRIPDELREESHRVFDRLMGSAGTSGWPGLVATLVPAYLRNFGSSEMVTRAVAFSLFESFRRDSVLTRSDRNRIDWKDIWAPVLDAENASSIVALAEREVHGHETGGYDDVDIAYAADLLKRIESGALLKDDAPEVRERASQLLERIAAMYESVRTYEPPPDGPPLPQPIIDEIVEKHGEILDEEEISF
jgi:SIR2-like domain